MKKILVFAFCLLPFALAAQSGWLNYAGAKNYAMWTTKWLQADNVFYWKGDTINKALLPYADIKTDSIRFKYIGGTWSSWYYAGASSGTYILPTASTTVKGGVKIGSGINITDGVISASYTETDPVYTAWNKSTGISIPHTQISDWATSVSSFVTGTPWTAMGYVTGTPWTSMGYLTANQAHTLDGHSNVTITANSSGEILKWNGSAWVNNTLAEAGIQPAGTYVTGTPWTSMGYLTDAPSDGTYYVRRNAAWVTSPSGADGNNYPTSLSFGTGTGLLTMARNGLADLSVSLDGRYSTTSHTDVVVDGDFASQGIMLRGATSGSYSILTNNSTNWNDAYTNMGKVYSTTSSVYAYLNTGDFVYHSGSGTIIASKTDLWQNGNNSSFTSAGAYNLASTKQDNLNGTGFVKASGTTITYDNSTYLTAVPNGSVTTAKMSIYGTPNSGDMLTYSSVYDLAWAPPITGTGTSGRVTYWNGTRSITSDADFTFDGLNLTVTGNITGGEVYRGSSRKLKTNIEEYNESATDILKATKIYSYNLKSNGSKGVGFIAEDTNPILSGENQVAHLMGNHLGILTKAFQEQDERISKLTASPEIQTLKLIIWIMGFFVLLLSMSIIYLFKTRLK